MWDDTSMWSVDDVSRLRESVRSRDQELTADQRHFGLAIEILRSYLGDRWIEKWSKRRLSNRGVAAKSGMQINDMVGDYWYAVRFAHAILDIAFLPGCEKKRSAWRADIKGAVGAEAEICVASALVRAGALVEFRPALDTRNYDFDVTMSHERFAVEVKGIDPENRMSASTFEKAFKTARKQLQAAPPSRPKLVAIRAPRRWAGDGDGSDVRPRLEILTNNSEVVGGVLVCLPVVERVGGWFSYQDQMIPVGMKSNTRTFANAVIATRQSSLMDLWTHPLSVND